MWWIHPGEYGMAIKKTSNCSWMQHLDKSHRPGVDQKKARCKGKHSVWREVRKMVTSRMVALTSKGHLETVYILVCVVVTQVYTYVKTP